MNLQKSLSRLVTRMLLLSFSVSSFTGLVAAIPPASVERHAIVVSAEQPNIWTLEQAHYLLAQMHRRNLDLKAEGLGKLDPNEINGLNFEVLRTLVEFGAVFDDAARFNNSLLKPQKRFDADRALRLRKQRDELADESFQLNRNIARLTKERALTKSPDEKDALTAQIDELTGLRDADEKEIERLDKDISAAGGPSGDVQNTAPPESTGANKLPQSSFDDSFKEITKTLIGRFNEAPKLNASLRLDNFLQMQYEIIAKQLTLLRDEVGPGERIIFLEMPQSVNAVYDKANNKWAQSWWKVAGYTKLRNPVVNDRRRSEERQAEGYNYESDSERATADTSTVFFTFYDLTAADTIARKLKQGDDDLSIYLREKGLSSATRQLLARYNPSREPTSALISALVQDFNDLLLTETLYKVTPNSVFETARMSRDEVRHGQELIAANRRLLEAAYPGSIRTRFVPREKPITTNMMIRDAKAAFGVNGHGVSDRVDYVKLDSEDQQLRVDDRSVRTIELIPRQGSLNVNDIKLRVRTGVLTAIARTLFGFGASLNVQRQRETFSQFVQQELYSSGFGKGAREFGWTFSPMPGADRVLSGTKTTYAVMVVPEEAESLVLLSNGCSFPRSEYQPSSFADTESERWADGTTNRGCGGEHAFAVPIPGGGDDKNYEFWVDGLEYVPAAQADRVMVSIYGRNFPAQIGMMVDGIPLTQSIGLAQPLIRDDSQAFIDATAELKDSKVFGRIERIDANQIVAVFEKPDSKDGVQPVLMLTAPGKAKILNHLKLYINRRHAALNDPDTPLLFGRRPADKDPFRIDNVVVFKNEHSGWLTAAVRGAGFQDSRNRDVLTNVFVNGNGRCRYSVASATLLLIEFVIPADDTIKVALIAPDPAANKPPITIESSPVANPGKLRVSNVAVMSYEARTEQDPGVLVVKIEGSGFSDDLMARLTEIGAADAVDLAVKSSSEAILTLRNPQPAVVVILRDTRTGQETKTVITRKSQ